MSILRYATYVPAYRLDPADSGVRGQRVVAAFDEDSTTMAVAAAGALGDLSEVEQVTLATSSPAYVDKTNAVAVAAALGLAPTVFASDTGSTARSTIAGLRSEAGLLVAADVRVGKPGSADERTGGDAAAALLLGEGPAIADLVATASGSDEFLDRWRDPQSQTGEQWEERFGFERYAASVRSVAERALDAAGESEADHVVLTSANQSVSKKAGSLVKGRLSTVTSPVGFGGANDPLIALAGVLDTAGPDETILLLSAVDGCDAVVLRTTELLPSRRQAVPLSDQVGRAGITARYTTYLSWRGLLDREAPRRPEPDRPAGPPSARGAGWKFGFTGARCTACGFAHLPPVRVCRSCGVADEMEPVPASRLRGTVATWTVDRLAYSPSPPVVDVVVDFEGGGRCALEVADADPGAVEVGTPVEVVFRRLFSAGRVHNYFWKARVL